MIYINKIKIHEFRGIRDLTHELNGKNFATCGPNGTGKSGIVDAIEFALTGNISRLAGAGTGGLSVKHHGPHVDSRDKPEQASVKLELLLPSLKATATIHRTVKNAGNPTISPDTPEIRAILDGAALHPEFVLSRRELIRYVVSNPGDRSKEVQALLRLDVIEKLRTTLQRIANGLDRDVKGCERTKKDTTAQLKSALAISQLAPSSILAAVNAQRQVLDLAPLMTLETHTSLKDGLATASSCDLTPKVAKAHAQSSLAVLQERLARLNDASFKEGCNKARAAVLELAADSESLQAVSRDSFIRQALKQFDDERCPVCDVVWDPAAFRAHLTAKLEQFSQAAAKRTALEAQLALIAGDMIRLRGAIASVCALGASLKQPIDVTLLASTEEGLAKRIASLQQLLPLEETAAALASAHEIPDISQAVTAITEAVAAIPEPSKQDAARDFLVLAQERLEAYRAAELALQEQQERAQRAKKVFEVYGDVTTKALEDIYKQVEAGFTENYRQINQEDEGGFTAQLIPSIGKLGFDVDFYGRGHFPPGAYHSEGHQDGMGLCLYLALMSHLLKSSFTFAVLDDVVMSVDAGHRREVCSLLKRRFPDTQFIFTTHDEIWLRHMRSEGLIKDRNFVHFRKWSVDLGPTEWDDRDVWQEIDDYLSKQDVRSAAALLRHYLEHFAKEVCERLRAKVEFRGDAQFALGDLLPNAISELGTLLKRGKVSATSWGVVVPQIAALETEFATAKQQTAVDQWQVNAAVHYNAWATLTSQDFGPVVAAYKKLVQSFTCEKCGELLYVSPDRGEKEALRCGCNSISTKLLTKSKVAA
jgi:hypothetical protein